MVGVFSLCTLFCHVSKHDRMVDGEISHAVCGPHVRRAAGNI
ncbi:hypothetical protein [Bartonella vinsonii]|nr:hypothetical protein [Bartonella vinsonii]